MLAAFMLTLVSRSAIADETLQYVAEMRNALSLWNWAEVARATLTTRDTTSCPGGGECRETRVWMTSAGIASALESIYPLRWLYRTAYRPGEKATLAFEELRKRRKADPGEYHWRHRVIWLAGGRDAATRYDLDEKGTTIPAALGSWITSDKADGLPLRVKNTKSVPMPLPALDRWGTFQSLRFLELAKGASWKLPGAGPKGPLSFAVTVERKESIQAAGRSWDTWKVRVDESKIDASGKDSAPLFAWIATDPARTPVRFDMDHDVGRLRLTLIE